MSEAERPADASQPLNAIEHIRLRPGMYVGNKRFFGFIHYLVSAFDLMLDHGAGWIEFEVGERFRVSSDACIPTRLSEAGLLIPFEEFDKLEPRHLPDGVILTALSDELRATLNDGVTQTTLTSANGERESLQTKPADGATPGTVLEFTPDTGIFSVTNVSPAVAHSYCKRIACLHPGVAFRIRVGDEIMEYRSLQGIRDFFASVTTPYQILHQPIHLQGTDGDLTVEAVFAFHSWTENQVWSFANQGRVPDGGTHEAGFWDGIARLHNRHGNAALGVLAVLAIQFPKVTYEGCIKARVGNDELQDRVSALVAKGLERWLREHPEEAARIETIERFQFGSIW